MQPEFPTPEQSRLYTEEFDRRQNFKRGVNYLVRKALQILSTIIIGVFLTVVLVNRPIPGAFGPREAQLDAYVRKGIENTIRIIQRENPEIQYMESSARSIVLDYIRNDLIEESGLNQPFFIKSVNWTLKA